MCLILYKPRTSEFNPELLVNAQDTNPHGVGFMFANKGTVTAIKGMWAKDKVRELWNKHRHKSLVVHFRMATQGRRDQENCHPFQVLNLQDHGRDLWMMHNGTFRNIEMVEQGKSDTYNFVQYVLKPYLIDKPGLIDKMDFQYHLEKKIGPGNKLFFLDGNGKTVVINEGAGHWKNGCWLSNLYSVKPATSRYYEWYENYGGFEDEDIDWVGTTANDQALTDRLNALKARRQPPNLSGKVGTNGLPLPYSY